MTLFTFFTTPGVTMPRFEMNLTAVLHILRKCHDLRRGASFTDDVIACLLLNLRG